MFHESDFHQQIRALLDFPVRCALPGLPRSAQTRSFPVRLLLNKRISVAEERCLASLCSYFAVTIVVTVASIFTSGVTGILIRDVSVTSRHCRYVRQSQRENYGDKGRDEILS